MRTRAPATREYLKATTRQWLTHFTDQLLLRTWHSFHCTTNSKSLRANSMGNSLQKLQFSTKKPWPCVGATFPWIFKKKGCTRKRNLCTILLNSCQIMLVIRPLWVKCVIPAQAQVGSERCVKNLIYTRSTTPDAPAHPPVNNTQTWSGWKLLPFLYIFSIFNVTCNGYRWLRRRKILTIFN